jgi:Tfp pilus assembly protein PilV
LEAIIAGVLFAVVTVFLMGIWDMQFKAMLKSKEAAIASFLAEQIMEECIAAGFEEADNLYPVAGEEIVIRSRTKKGISNTKYLVKVITDVPDPASAPDIMTVVVTVEYNDTTSPTPRTIEYHTVLNEHG